MPAHRRRGNEAAVGEVLQLVAKQIGTFLLLTTPVSRRSACRVPSAVEIRLHHVEVVVNRTVDAGTLGPRNASIGNEDVQATVEIPDSLINDFLRSLGILQIDLICLG